MMRAAKVSGAGKMCSLDWLLLDYWTELCPWTASSDLLRYIARGEDQSLFSKLAQDEIITAQAPDIALGNGPLWQLCCWSAPLSPHNRYFCDECHSGSVTDAPPLPKGCSGEDDMCPINNGGRAVSCDDYRFPGISIG